MKKYRTIYIVRKGSQALGYFTMPQDAVAYAVASGADLILATPNGKKYNPEIVWPVKENDSKTASI